MDDLTPLEEEIVAPEAEAPAAPLSIREELGSALAKSKEEKPEIESKELKIKPDKPRADDGKFVPDKKVSRETKKTVEAATSIAPEPEIKIPQSVPQTLAEEWKKLPRNLQELYAKRDEDFQKKLTIQDEERNFAREMREVINPYMPVIRSEGGDPKKAVQELLNTAYLLRTATPQQKGALLWQAAQRFGADMRQNGQTAQQPFNPELQSVLQQVQNLKSTIEQERTQKKQQEDLEIQQQIKSFSEDAKHPHFEAVKAEMSALLKSGIAQNLQDAYDRAVYSNPQTRSTLLQENQKSLEEQRVADKKAKAEAAKKAGSSIKGAPGMAALKNGKITQPDLRSEIRAAFASHAEG